MASYGLGYLPPDPGYDPNAPVPPGGYGLGYQNPAPNPAARPPQPQPITPASAYSAYGAGYAVPETPFPAPVGPGAPPVMPQNPTGVPSTPSGAYQAQPSGNPTGVPSFPTNAPSGLQGTGFVSRPVYRHPGVVAAALPPQRPVLQHPSRQWVGPGAAGAPVVPNPATQQGWWQNMFGLGGNRGMTGMLLDRAAGPGNMAGRS